MGGEFNLAALCDIRISTGEAVLAHSEIKFGAPVLFGPLRETLGGGAIWLPARAGGKGEPERGEHNSNECNGPGGNGGREKSQR